MNAFEFGAYTAEKLAFGGAAGFVGRPPVKPPAPPAPPKPPTYSPAPNKMGGPSIGSVVQDMSNNGARVGGGILSSVAGGIGAAGTGLVAGATNAWNAVTPKSMNTSQGWSQGANGVFNKALNFAHAGVKDVVGGLGGDTNYSTQHAWNEMEKGFNDPNVDSTSRNVARASGLVGHGAWNIAQTVANPGKILANAPRAGINPLTWARQGSRIIPGARGGVQTAATAPRALPQLGAAGRVINNIDDVGAGTLETGNVVNQGIQTARNNLATYAQPQDNTYAYAE